MSMFIQTFSRQLEEWVDQIRRQPQDVLVRAGVIYVTLGVLILPVFLSMYLMMEDIFIAERLKNWQYGMFEALVIGVVFLFGVGIIYTVSAGNRVLQSTIVGVAFVMVLFSGTFLGQVSNSCIPDGCSGQKYMLSLGIITVLNILAYIMPTAIRFRVPYFGIVFLAVAVWQSEVWMLISMSSIGIAPTMDNIRGLFLLIFTLFWVAVYSATFRNQPEEAPLV